MYTDPFNQRSIYDEHFWKSSQCIWHENTLLDFFRSLLINSGYNSVDNSNKVWKKNDKTVVVCLVDDIRSCSTDYQSDFPYLYDKNTTVVTDNRITCPTQFKILELPKSFFGIYSNQSLEQIWKPTRDFTFAINRLDTKRLEVFLEIHKRTNLNNGHVNFNCFQHDNSDHLQAFEQQWSNLSVEKQQYYQENYNKLKNLVPLRNYDFEHELSYYKSYLNVVVESYSSDHVIAFSEKIFRALISPVPWTVLSGRYSVAYLQQLGFDVLDDLVNHNEYDRLIEDQNKVDCFVWQGNKAIAKMKEMNFDQLQQRCQQAAIHNQQLLLSMRREFSNDLLIWMDNFRLALK